MFLVVQFHTNAVFLEQRSVILWFVFGLGLSTQCYLFLLAVNI